jgi:hypothetical protein
MPGRCGRTADQPLFFMPLTIAVTIAPAAPTPTLGRGNRQALEPAVIAFLNTDPVIRWVKWLIT